MSLSPEEERFLRHWMYDEVHYQEGVGAAKQLQRQHRVRPADVAVLIAAAIPDPSEQEAAGFGPPPEPPMWPWSALTWPRRLEEARRVLSERQRQQPRQRPEKSEVSGA